MLLLESNVQNQSVFIFVPDSVLAVNMMEEGTASQTDMSIEFKEGSKDGMSQVTLFNLMKQNDYSFWLLKLTGNYWPAEYNLTRDLLSWETIHIVLFIICRVAVVLVIGFSIYFVAEEIKAGDLLGIMIAITFFLDALSVLPTHCLNQIRMQRFVIDHDETVFDQCNLVTARFGLVCLVSLGVSIMSGSILHQEPYQTVLISMGELCMAMYLVFNLWFLMLDLSVSSRLIDELIAQCDTRQLTLDRFNVVRSAIHSRVSKSKWASDFILVPCVTSTIAIMILAFHMRPNNIIYAVGWISAVMKEMVFICVAFTHVATVNYKADLLTEKLSSTLWVSPVDNSTTSTMHCPGNQEKDDDQESLLGPSRDKEIERLTMCVSSLTKPISFTLLFKRVSWQNVLVSAVGLVATLLVGVLRSALFQQ